MSTIFKSILNDIFQLTENRAKKNGRHKGPINDDLTSAHTLGTPQNSLCAGTAGLGCREEVSSS
jgi:hypothetical protein